MSRPISWFLAVAALVAPTIWARLQVAAFDRAHPGNGCGMPILGIYLTAAIACGVLSFAAGLCAVVATRGVARPLSWRRRAEVAGLLVPGLLGVAFVGLVLFV